MRNDFLGEINIDIGKFVVEHHVLLLVDDDIDNIVDHVVRFRMLLRGRWVTSAVDGRWWAYRCDGCGSERAMRAETPGDAARGLGLKTMRLERDGDLEHYCAACQAKGA